MFARFPAALSGEGGSPLLEGQVQKPQDIFESSRRKVNPSLWGLQVMSDGEHLAGILTLRRCSNLSEIPYENFPHSWFKMAYIMNCYSCCTYVNNQAKHVETRLILKWNWFQFGYPIPVPPPNNPSVDFLELQASYYFSP